MSKKKYSKAQRKVAQEILDELEQEWKSVKTGDIGQLFYRLYHFIKQTYLSENNKR